MNVTNLTSATVVASGVWTNAARTITGLNGAMTFAQGQDHQTLANGTAATLGSGANKNSLYSIVGEATANATYNIGVVNTIVRIGVTGASGGPLMQTVVATAQMAAFISNTGTASGFYSYSQMTWNQ